eukprot:6364476-Prymnesium_polylepis.1
MWTELDGLSADDALARFVATVGDGGLGRSEPPPHTRSGVRCTRIARIGSRVCTRIASTHQACCGGA